MVRAMQKISVLLADDNEGDANLTRWALKEAAIECHISHVRNGKEALDHLNNAAENNTVPHLAILDVNMPQIIGCDVLKALRKDNRFDGLTIVMLTTSDCALRKHCCYENGADIFIRKKMDLNDFIEQIQWLKGFWHDIEKHSVGNPEEYRNNRTSL